MKTWHFHLMPKQTCKKKLHGNIVLSYSTVLNVSRWSIWCTQSSYLYIYHQTCHILTIQLRLTHLFLMCVTNGWMGLLWLVQIQQWQIPPEDNKQ